MTSETASILLRVGYDGDIVVVPGESLVLSKGRKKESLTEGWGVPGYNSKVEETGANTSGLSFGPMRFGRVTVCRLTKSKLTDIRPDNPVTLNSK